VKNIRLTRAQTALVSTCIHMEIVRIRHIVRSFEKATGKAMDEDAAEVLRYLKDRLASLQELWDRMEQSDAEVLHAHL